MITVTHSAVNQIKKMMTSRSNTPHGVKLGINTKGCSGLSYTLEYVDNVDANDEVFEFDNIKSLWILNLLYFLLALKWII